MRSAAFALLLMGCGVGPPLCAGARPFCVATTGSSCTASPAVCCTDRYACGEGVMTPDAGACTPKASVAACR
jgi:hypothetical protein